MKNLLDFSQAQLIAFFKTLGEPAYRATQIQQWLYQRSVRDINDMTNLSKALREKLADVANVQLPEIAFDTVSRDGTHKWLLRLSDGNAIEMVFIPCETRGTLCVSSQVGCALNCSFCSTGKQGFNRNLTLGEIMAQLWIAAQQYRVTNVVFMGMGEPLLNYDNVLAATQFMLDDNAYGLSKYRVTVSTSGVVPAMVQLQQDSEVALAVSLHAANDDLRNALVPLNKKYPLSVLMQTCREYFAAEPRRSITFEYVMLDGVNDTMADAKALKRLLSHMPCKVNLIPFNPFPKTQYRTSSPEQVDRFQRYLIDAGISTWVRRTRGDREQAACGQLTGKFTDRTGRHVRWQKTGSLIPGNPATSNEY